MARSGWKPHWRSSGREALDSLQARATPVVLCPEEMQDMIWREFQRQITGARIETQVIVASSGTDRTLWAEVINAGGFDLLLEPFCAGDVNWLLGAAHRFQSTFPKRGNEAPHLADEKMMATSSGFSGAQALRTSACASSTTRATLRATTKTIRTVGYAAVTGGMKPR